MREVLVLALDEDEGCVGLGLLDFGLDFRVRAAIVSLGFQVSAIAKRFFWVGVHLQVYACRYLTRGTAYGSLMAVGPASISQNAPAGAFWICTRILRRCDVLGDGAPMVSFHHAPQQIYAQRPTHLRSLEEILCALPRQLTRSEHESSTLDMSTP